MTYKVFGQNLRVSRKSLAWGLFLHVGKENVLKVKCLTPKGTAIES